MKVAVMGAGAVGCYYGAMLARAGHDVVLIGRARHVDAIRERGLLLEIGGAIERVSVGASTDVAALAGAQVVLCCVKSRDTLACAQAMASFVQMQTRVLSLQNGVDNAQVLAGVLGAQVAPVVVYVAVGMVGDGHVRHFGRGELVLAPDALSVAQQEAFAGAGIALCISDAVVDALWTKLVVNCAYNAVSAITQMSYGPLWRAEGVIPLMRTVMEECQAVAVAEGVSLPEDLWARIAAIAMGMPEQRSSTAQDLQAGRPTEMAHLNGYIVRRAQALGISAPANQALATLVGLLEQPESGKGVRGA